MSSTATADEGSESPFNYVPSFTAGVTFVALFGLVTGLHLLQALHRRAWWLLPTVVLGGVGETIGWSGRLWGSRDPMSMNPYLMQITTTIISPTFILATNFVTVGRIIQKLGPQFSRLRPRLYTIVFCACDVIALIVQSVGGGMSSVALAANDWAGTVRGGHIALGGIAFQFAAIVIYMLLAAEFLVRYHLGKPFPHRGGKLIGKLLELDSKMKQMILGVGLSSLCLFTRGIYRTIELTEGWTGAIISNQRLFIGLDGSMILLSMVILSVFHPGRLMPRETHPTKWADRYAIELLPNLGRTNAVGEKEQKTTLSERRFSSICLDGKNAHPVLSLPSDIPSYGGWWKGAESGGYE